MLTTRWLNVQLDSSLQIHEQEHYIHMASVVIQAKAGDNVLKKTEKKLAGF